jgi:surfactin synthase thioesterase subunit
MTGTRDSSLESDPASGWRAQTRGTFEHHVLDGEHLFINTQTDAVMQIVSERMLAARAQLANPNTTVGV